MSEEKENISNQAEEIKKETVEAAKKVKESVKNVNIKDETKKTKNFITKMFKEPLETIKETACDTSNKVFKTALFILIVWAIAIFIKSTYSTIHYWGFARVWNNILVVLKAILAPACGILVYSLIAYLMNKENKKSLITNITTLTITQLPNAIASVAVLLTLFGSKMSTLTTPFKYFCTVLSIVLTYFGLKALFNEEDDKKFFKKYVVLQLIYFVCYIVISFLGIYIY